MVFCKEIATHQWDSACLKYQCASCSKRQNATATEWVNQEKQVKRTHSLFIDDLKVYQGSHKILKDVNETILQASHDNGACYGVAKCAEIIFEKEKMVKGEGIQVLQEMMKTVDPDQKEIYKFLGVEQADGIKTKKVYNRVKEEINRRLQILTKTELNDKNLIKAI